MRVVIAAIGLLLVWQGLQVLLFIKTTRRTWAFLQQRSDAELQRAGLAVLLLGLLLVCVT